MDEAKVKSKRRLKILNPHEGSVPTEYVVAVPRLRCFGELIEIYGLEVDHRYLENIISQTDPSSKKISTWESCRAFPPSYNSTQSEYPKPQLLSFTQRLCREIITWKHLSHPNILALLGVSIPADTHCFRILTRWMPNGNIVQYAKSNPTANRLQLTNQVTVLL